MPTKEEVEAYAERIGLSETGKAKGSKDSHTRQHMAKPRVSTAKRGAKFVHHPDGGVELPGSKRKQEKYYSIGFPRWAYIEIKYRAALEKLHPGQWIVKQLGLVRPD